MSGSSNDADAPSGDAVADLENEADPWGPPPTVDSDPDDTLPKPRKKDHDQADFQVLRYFLGGAGWKGDKGKYKNRAVALWGGDHSVRILRGPSHKKLTFATETRAWKRGTTLEDAGLIMSDFRVRGFEKGSTAKADLGIRKYWSIQRIGDKKKRGSSKAKKEEGDGTPKKGKAAKCLDVTARTTVDDINKKLCEDSDDGSDHVNVTFITGYKDKSTASGTRNFRPSDFLMQIRGGGHGGGHFQSFQRYDGGRPMVTYQELQSALKAPPKFVSHYKPGDTTHDDPEGVKEEFWSG